MKKYMKPTMEGEFFAPNEFVAACWKINCNVPSGIGFIDNNNNNKYEFFIDTLLTPADYGPMYPETASGCGKWHTGVAGVPDDGPVANAKWQPLKWSERYEQYKYDGPAYDVYYWRDGKGKYDIHFSKVEDAQWETNPNAS